MTDGELPLFCEICTSAPAEFAHTQYGPGGTVLDISAYCGDCQARVSQAVWGNSLAKLRPVRRPARADPAI